MIEYLTQPAPAWAGITVAVLGILVMLVALLIAKKSAVEVRRLRKRLDYTQMAVDRYTLSSDWWQKRYRESTLEIERLMGDLQVPNLDDGCTAAELDELSEVFAMLREYCAYKSEAMSLRKVGNITQALRLEDMCERLYKRLPEKYRW
jgi:hypothetical protein